MKLKSLLLTAWTTVVSAFFPHHPHNMCKYMHHEIGKKIVIDMSYTLPKLDVGYDVLHANHQFIMDMLTMHDNIPDDVKKDIILLSIKMAQYGDNVGSYFFEQYYRMVDLLL